MKKAIYALFAISLTWVLQPSLGIADDHKLASKQEVMEMFVGNTVPWSSGKGAGYFAEGGNMPFKQEWDGAKGKGSWRITDDAKICVNYEADWWKDGEQCYAVYVDGKKFYTLGDNGKKNHNHKNKIKAGNTL